jgi:hypothetical protein
MNTGVSTGISSLQTPITGGLIVSGGDYASHVKQDPTPNPHHRQSLDCPPRRPKATSRHQKVVEKAL